MKKFIKASNLLFLNVILTFFYFLFLGFTFCFYEATRLKPWYLLAQLHRRRGFADSTSAKKHSSMDKSVVSSFCYKMFLKKNKDSNSYWLTPDKKEFKDYSSAY